MRALVTGAHGFVGQHLVRHLEAEGDDVVVLDRSGRDPVDITDADAVTAAIGAAAPEAVYHLAGWADVGASWSDPAAAFRVNAEGTLNVLLACRDRSVQRVISVGSADVYGVVRPEDLPLTEQSPLRPTSPYAAGKAAAEQVAVQAHLGHNVPVIRVRPFNHLGPGQSDRFVAPALAARIARAERDGAPSITVGNLSPRRDFTDVRDVVRAYRLLVERGLPGEVYNVCSGRDLAIQELADQLVGMADRAIALEVDESLLRPIDLPVLRGDANRLREATGWKPEIPLEQTLADLLADMRRRVEDPAATP